MTLSAIADGSSHALRVAQRRGSSSSSSHILPLCCRPVSPRSLRIPAAIRPVQTARRPFSLLLESDIQTCAARGSPLPSSGAGSSTVFALAPARVIPAAPNAILTHPSSHSLAATTLRPSSLEGRTALRNTRRGAPRAFFSTSSRTMTATKIDGTAIAKKIRERLHAEIAEKQKVNPRYTPSLRIIQGLSRPIVSLLIM